MEKAERVFESGATMLMQQAGAQESGNFGPELPTKRHVYDILYLLYYTLSYKIAAFWVLVAGFGPLTYIVAALFRRYGP